MKILLCICTLALSCHIFSQPGTVRASKVTQRHILPNGWGLSPAGRSLPLGDLPLNIAVSASKKYIAITNNGQSVQSIQLINAQTEKILDNVVIPKSWYGLKFSRDEKYLYASGGNDNRILRYAVSNNKLILNDSLVLGNPWPNKISPTGLEIDDEKQILYVVTKDDSSLYLFNLHTKKIINRHKLGSEAYSCLLAPGGKELYISCWGCDKVLIFNTLTQTIRGNIAVGDNPNDLCLTKNGQYLFVANANDNSVSVISVKQRKVIETLNAALYPGSKPGSTSNGVALATDEKTLYIANADNNCLSVFDVSKPGMSKSKGFIPVGWYPTNVKVIGNRIFVANGKGFSSKANPYGPNPLGKSQVVTSHAGDSTRPREVEYIGGLFKGTLSIVDVPTPAKLAAYSKMVYANSPYIKEKELLSKGEAGNPVPEKVGDASP